MSGTQDFPLELDHVVIFVTPEAPELAAISALGLHPFGERTEHAGMGTASTAIFFDNAYLELLWIADHTLAEQVWGGVGMDLTSREPGTDKQSSALPFGLALRRRSGAEGQLPFPTRQISAAWMEPPIAIELAGESQEPFYLVIPPGLTYPSFRDHLPPSAHPIGVRSLTGVRITAPDTSDITPIAAMLQSAGVVTFQSGPIPLMELTLDNGTQGKVADARPTLPLILYY